MTQSDGKFILRRRRQIASCVELGTSMISTGSFILRRRGQIASCRRKVGLVTQSGFGDAKNIFGNRTQFASLDPN